MWDPVQAHGDKQSKYGREERQDEAERLGEVGKEEGGQYEG